MRRGYGNHLCRRVLLVPKSAASVDMGIVREETPGGRVYLEPCSLVSLGDDLTTVRKELETLEQQCQQQLITATLSSVEQVDACCNL
jgi:hypothetical protein